MLDFIVLINGHVGGNAFAHACNLHPELWMEIGQADALLNERRDREILELAPVDRKAGVGLHHARDIFPQEWLDEVGSGHRVATDFAERLRRLSRRRHAIQLVRDPAPHIQSLCNYTISAKIIEDANSGADRFDEKSHDLNTEIRRRCLLCGLQHQVAKQALHDAQGTLLFDRWEVIDTSELMPATAQGTMRGVYERLGVDPTFRSPSIGRVRGSLARRYLQHFPFYFAFDNARIICRLDFVGWTEEYETILAFAPSPNGYFTDLDPDLFPESNAVLVLSSANISSEEMTKLISGNWFHDAFQEALPKWSQKVRRAHERFLSCRVNGFDGEQLAMIRTIIQDDVDRLCRKHPRLRDIWTWR